MLIRLHGCAGLSAPLLSANPRRLIFSRRGSITCNTPPLFYTINLPVISLYLHAEWKTVWILNSWSGSILISKQDISGFRPNKKISVFWVGTYIFLIFFFLEKNIIVCILKGEMPFKMHKIIFFFKKTWRILGFTIKLRQGRANLNTDFFYFA